MVARILVETRRGPFPVRTKFLSNCGLPQCVNPDHWTPQLPPLLWRVAVFAGVARLVDIATGALAPDGLVTRVYDRDRVHVAAVSPRGLLPMCGAALDPTRLSVVYPDVEVTCVGGC